MKTWTTGPIAAGVLLFAAVSAARGDVSKTTRVGALDYVEGSAFVNGEAVAANSGNLPILVSRIAGSAPCRRS